VFQEQSRLLALKGVFLPQARLLFEEYFVVEFRFRLEDVE